MAENNSETPPMSYPRIAGALYLLIIVCGIFSEAFLLSSLIVAGATETTATNIIQSQTLFRIGSIADPVMLLSDVAIAILFYLLFKPVNKALALLLLDLHSHGHDLG